MKLIYDGYQDRHELRLLVILFINSRGKGTVTSGMDMRVYINRTFGIDIDHHEYAYALDELCTQGKIAYCAYHGGDTQYTI